MFEIVQTACQHATLLLPAALLCDAVQAGVQLVQQLQRCGPVLMSAGAAAASTSSSSSHEACLAYSLAQHAAAGFLRDLSLRAELGQLGEEVAGLLEEALLEPALQEMLLQLLTSSALLMQQLQQHPQQQQLHSRVPQSSSSSGSIMERCQQLRSDLLPIPAFHRDMLPLLPGGQAYLDEAAAGAGVLEWGGLLPVKFLVRTWECTGLLAVSIDCHLNRCQESTAAAAAAELPALSPAAVRLVLELQLLLASTAQQQQQQQRMSCIHSCNALLVRRIKGFLSITGSSCLPPEVLQQAGLQLLQALAVPLQLCITQNWPADMQLGVELSRNWPLYALRAAAAGLVSVEDLTHSGELG
jgi:hypothetical protein